MHVAQAGHTEHEAILLALRDVETAQVRVVEVATVREEVTQHPEPFEHVATDSHALMAARAAVTLEYGIALLRLGRDGLGVSPQVAIERGVWGDERTLVIEDR